jgi:hypothetical protein
MEGDKFLFRSGSVTFKGVGDHSTGLLSLETADGFSIIDDSHELVPLQGRLAKTVKVEIVVIMWL